MCIEQLILAKAQIEARDREGMTPLMIAARNSENPRILKTLLAHGAELEPRDDYGQTALSHGVRYDHAQSVETLIGVGADINTVDNKGGSVEYLAVSLNRHDALKTMMRCEKWQVSEDLRDDTLLDYAAWFGDSEILGILQTATESLTFDPERKQTIIDAAIRKARWRVQINKERQVPPWRHVLYEDPEKWYTSFKELTSSILDPPCEEVDGCESKRDTMDSASIKDQASDSYSDGASGAEETWEDAPGLPDGGSG